MNAAGRRVEAGNRSRGRRLTLGLLVKGAAAGVNSRLGGSFSVDATPKEAPGGREPSPPPQRLRLHAERISDAVDDDAAVEALERAHAIYIEYSIFQEGDNWEDVVGPALRVTH